MDSRLILGRVVSLAATSTNWPSIVHWTVTGNTKKERNQFHVKPQSRVKQDFTLTSFPIIAVLTIKTAVYGITPSSYDARFSTRNSFIVLHLAFLNLARCMWQHSRHPRKLRILRELFHIWWGCRNTAHSTEGKKKPHQCQTYPCSYHCSQAAYPQCLTSQQLLSFIVSSVLIVSGVSSYSTSQ